VTSCRQNPLTRLRQVAVDLGRFADELEADTDLEPQVFRYWQAQLLEIAAELEGHRPGAGVWAKPVHQ
jgi:hypothetical protein